MIGSRLSLMLILWTALCWGVAPSAAQPREVNIGIVADGPWALRGADVSVLKKEVVELTRNEFDVRFSGEHEILADRTPEGVARALDELFADQGVDLIVSLGPLCASDLARRGPLPKPVVAAFAFDIDLQGLPFDSGSSGVDNFNYLVIGATVERDLRSFRVVTGFRNVSFLFSATYLEAARALREEAVDAARAVGAVANVISVGEDVASALSAVAPESDAVYLGPVPHLSLEEFSELTAGLIERKLPSFSAVGRADVDRGILAGTSLEQNREHLLRQAALNIQSILLGENASGLPVMFATRERLTINMETARAVGVYPKWSVLTEAEVLHDVRKEAGRTLSLAGTVREARQVNLDLAAADRRVAAGEQAVKQARAGLMPQASVSGQGFIVDKDRADSSFGSLGRRNLAATAEVSQVIYSEGVRANYAVEKKQQKLRSEEREQLRLDITRDAALAYLNVLRAKTLERIEKDNLSLSRSNLELAMAREEIGTSTLADVYRWQNQIASNRRTLIEANSQRNLAEIALNRILNRPLEEHFITKEAALDDEELTTSYQRLGPYVDNPLTYDVFRDFIVKEGVGASPELSQLQAAIEAQERVLAAHRRSFYVPDIGVSAGITGYKRYGAGFPELPSGFNIPRVGSVDWTLAMTASLPIFQGGARFAAVSKAREDISRLRLEKEATEQRVGQRIRTALHQAGSSYVAIQLAQDAAEAARNNLRLVIDSYSRGAAPIITLLDAQNAALVAEQVAANAVYNYLIDLMELQRAVGRFDFFASEEDQESWMDRLEQYFQQAGVKPNRS